MTGDVEEECSLLRISPQLGEPVSSDTCISVTQADSSIYINSNMTVEDNCIYTAAIPADLSANFAEGTVLQIMPDSTIVALAMKTLPTSNGNTVIFKDSAFASGGTVSQNTLTNILAESTDNCESQSVDEPVCTEENISDIDLSFLNETEDNGAISDTKTLNESAVKELQGMITDVSSQPLNLLQGDLNLTDNSVKASQELQHSNTEQSKDTNGPPGDVVMIDISKPIQLSQNSLIMVNGQKCVLQHDPQTGQVVAYPVKEQEKPRKKRGRPRKSSVDPAMKGDESSENVLAQGTESLSEEEREKGLLEIMNDEGALVRRSTRKRKRAKVLRDYETGNLKQELGSDVEDVEFLDKDTEIRTRRKKARGPGRPRKYPKSVEALLAPAPPDPLIHPLLNDGLKQQRGRHRKVVSELEPTQAFLVQTADGQTLMMQVPLSSIPPGISLQEMAQEIANKLNFGLSQQTSTAVSSSRKDTNIKEMDSLPAENVSDNISCQTATAVSEPALQDHSVGSTTNICTATNDVQQLSSTNENSEGAVDSSCQDMINNLDHIVVDQVCTSEIEVTLESENCTKDANTNIQNMMPENIMDNQNNLNSLDVPQCSEDNFCLNMTSTPSCGDSLPILSSLAETDQYCVKSNIEETLKENFSQVQTCESSKIPKDIFMKNDFLKDKVNIQLLLQNTEDTTSETQTMQIEQMLKNVNSSNISDGLILNVSNFKNNASYTSELLDQKDCNDKQYTMQQMSNIDCQNPASENVFECEPLTRIESNPDSDCLKAHSVVVDIETNEAIQRELLQAVETSDLNSSDEKSVSQFIKSENSNNQTYETILPPHEMPSTETLIASEETGVSTIATTVMSTPEKVLPVILPVQPASDPKKCKICQTPYITNEELVEHFKAKHPKCICIECNYMSEQPCAIKRHSYRHNNQGYICKICNKKYKDFYILRMHVRMVHLPPAVWFTCDICEKRFTRKAHLKRHLRIHAPVKQYQCPHCKYQGCEKSDITKHLLIHEDPKFKCDICGKAFRHMKNRDLHLKRHSGRRDYKCGVCDFYGYTFTDIRKHIERRHSNAACSDCSQVFKDAALLREHKKMGPCKPVLLHQEAVKIEENSNSENSKETALLDEMLTDLLDSEQPQIMISGCTEETLSALQNGQLIMTSLEGLLNTQNGQLVVEGLNANNLVRPDNLSLISVDKDSDKMITLVTADGRNVALPLKNCASLPLECITTSLQNTPEKIMLINEAEVTS